MRASETSEGWRASVPTVCLAIAAVLWLLVASAVAVDAQQEPRLQRAVARFLGDPSVKRGVVGLEVVDVKTGRVLASAGAERALIPASNMKIATALAALEFLGDEHIFHTTLTAIGPVRDGVLRGALVLSGNGDARFGLPGEEGPARWAKIVRDAGIRRVTGGIVIHEAELDRVYAHPDWIERYAAADGTAPNVAALGNGTNRVEVHVRGSRRLKARGRVTVKPDCGHVTVRNRTVTVKGRGSGPGSKRAWGSNELTVAGRVRVGRTRRGSAAVHDPPLFLARTLVHALKKRGVDVEGKIVRAAPSGEERCVLARHETTMDWMIGRALKNSDNRVTEILYKSAGRAFDLAQRGGDGAGAPGSFESGARAVGEVIRRATGDRATGTRGTGSRATGNAAPAVLRDGSGLSRKNRLSAHSLAALLRWAFERPYHAAFVRALARGGERGSTLKHRFRDPALASNLRAKTGYLFNVRSLSGYLRVGPRRMVAFSVLMNDLTKRSPKARKALDWFVAATLKALTPTQ